jgi:hypothetical protein
MPRGGGKVQIYFSLSLAQDGDGWIIKKLSCFTPGKEPDNALYRMLAGH